RGAGPQRSAVVLRREGVRYAGAAERASVGGAVARQARAALRLPQPGREELSRGRRRAAPPAGRRAAAAHACGRRRGVTDQKDGKDPKKRGLGRGLGALMPGTPAREARPSEPAAAAPAAPTPGSTGERNR